jgi:hypothetical protein
MIVFCCGFRKFGQELLDAVARVIGTRPLEETVTVMLILAGHTFASKRISNGRSLVNIPQSNPGTVVKGIERAVKKIDRLPDCRVVQIKIKAFDQIRQDGRIGLS